MCAGCRQSARVIGWFSRVTWPEAKKKSRQPPYTRGICVCVSVSVGEEGGWYSVNFRIPCTRRAPKLRLCWLGTGALVPTGGEDGTLKILPGTKCYLILAREPDIRFFFFFSVWFGWRRFHWGLKVWIWIYWGFQRPGTEPNVLFAGIREHVVGWIFAKGHVLWMIGWFGVERRWRVL